jgi:serine protease AprX
MVLSRTVWGCLIVLMNVPALAQTNRYMVMFKDKNGSAFSTSNPIEFLSQKAIDRRIKQAIAVTEQDIPVNDTYVQAVKGTGAEVYFRTRWMNGVLVQCSPALASTIQSLPSVDRVELVAPNAKLTSQGRKKSSAKAKSIKTIEATKVQLQMIGVDKMQADGFKGEGMTIAIMDAGFPGVNLTTPFQHIFSDNRIDTLTSYDFVYNSKDVFQYDEHGTEVFSVIAAYQSGTFTGGAYKANYQLYVTEDVESEYRVEEYNWLFAAERADSAGTDVISSSLGYYSFDDASMNYPKSALDGQTAVVSRAAQWAADRGIVVVLSAGNEGANSWQMITAPADAKDVFAVANVNSSGIRSSSSSIGPSADNRIKPDVAALGSGTSVIKKNGALGSASGTSLAAPLITSLVAGVWQRYPELTSQEVLEVVRKSASQAANPDNLIGYGIPNFKAVENYMATREQEDVFVVYPNPPITDTITIRPFDPAQVSTCHVEIVSSQGQVLSGGDISFSWETPTYTSDISQLSPGMYFIRIVWGSKHFVYKIVKME